MDAKELAVVVVGLFGTYCLPWPATEVAGEGQAGAASPAKTEAAWTDDRVRRSVETPIPRLLCESRN